MKPLQTKVLVIDDDEELLRLLSAYLSRNGYQVTTSQDPINGIRLIESTQPDMVILDVMMPEIDGFETCRRIRQQSDIPVIMLTARGEVTDRIVGLEVGADDYLPKPFEPRELDARIRSVLRRGRSGTATEKIVIGELEVFPEKFTARLNGRQLDLTSFEFELLCLFVKQRGRVLSRDRLMESLKGNDWSAFDRSVDMQVSRLRQKLGDDPRDPLFIRTVRGVGYIFMPE